MKIEATNGLRSKQDKPTLPCIVYGIYLDPMRLHNWDTRNKAMTFLKMTGETPEVKGNREKKEQTGKKGKKENKGKKMKEGKNRKN